MRTLIQNYTFNKSAKQITFTDYASIVLEKVLLVTDVTNNTTIYQANDPSKGGTIAGNVLTLTYDTTGSSFANGDKLQVFYEADAENVSVTSSALPTGAATAAKQPSLGTAGTPSADVITVQGTTSMTPVKVDGSAVTQPVSGSVTVSGTVTANLGTIDGVATDTTLAETHGSVSGGTAATKSDLAGGVHNSSAPSLTNGQQASLQLDASGSLKTTLEGGFVSTLNSTTTPLSVSGVFTGSWEDVTNYASITTITKSDVASTLYAEFSPDGTNVDRTLQLNDGTSGDIGIHTLIPVAKYFRMRLVNDGSSQTYLRLQVLLNKTGRVALPVSRFNTAIGEYTDVLNVRAGVVGKYNTTPPTLTDGQRTDIQLDKNGRLVTSFVASVKESSTSALSANATYTSQTFDTVNGQNFMSASVFSTTDMLIYYDESSDGTNWATVDESFVKSGEHNDASHKISSRYCRVRVQNGIVANAGGIANLYIAISQDAFGVQQDVALVDQFGGRITSDTSWGLRVRTPQDTETFGAGINHARISQVSANFSQSLTFNDVTQTVTSTGTIAAANGSATLATGTSTSSTAKLNSNTTLSYTPGREAYAVFTAAFTTPTNANSYQRIGLYDTSNGFFVGYSGTSFGVTWRQNGVDTFTALTSANEDTLSGQVNSFFTRGGVPEAIDPTKKNIYRIRFGWLGAAPIRFEVMSPDGRWARFHVIRYPNTAINPSLYSISIPVTAEVSKTTSNATNLQLSTSSWDAGVVDAPDVDLDYNGTISAVNGAVTSQTKSKGTISFSLTGTWSGTLVIEAHNGDSSWTQVTGYTSAGSPVTSITTNQFFFVNCAAFTQVRLRASALASGSVTVQTTATHSLVSIFTQTEGNSAAGVTDTGNPLKVGGLGKTTQPTAVTDGQRTNILTDKLGRVIVAPGHVRDLVTRQYTQLTNTITTAIVTAVAATFNDITTLVITNASNQSVNLTLADGATTVAVFNLAANGGLVFNPTVPLKQSAVNTAWNATLSATATVNVTAIAVQNI
jgi:hypothetical protein